MPLPIGILLVGFLAEETRGLCDTRGQRPPQPDEIVLAFGLRVDTLVLAGAASIVVLEIGVGG